MPKLTADDVVHAWKDEQFLARRRRRSFSGAAGSAD